MLIGIDDTDDDSVLGVNAGHPQNSALHCLHTCFSMSCDILISLNVISKSKLAQRLWISLLYWIPALNFSVDPGMKSLLAASAPSVWLVVPGS